MTAPDGSGQGTTPDTTRGDAVALRAIDAVRNRFPEAIEEQVSFRGEETIRVKADQLPGICRFLKEEAEFGYDVLTDIMASHWLERDYEYEVSYLLTSHRNNSNLRLKVRSGGRSGPPGIPTVTGVWGTADWHEREEWDKVGVIFDGHPNMKRILLPEDWEGHPLRKDYPMEGIGA